jgi:hypothetical protein
MTNDLSSVLRWPLYRRRPGLCSGFETSGGGGRTISLTRLIIEKSGGGDDERVEGDSGGSEGGGEAERAGERFPREGRATEWE